MAKPKEAAVETQGDGIRRYTKRTIDIFFPGDTVCCARCPLLETYARKQCRRTGEYIVEDKTPGVWCPLVNPDTGEIEGVSY